MVLEVDVSSGCPMPAALCMQQKQEDFGKLRLVQQVHVALTRKHLLLPRALGLPSRQMVSGWHVYRTCASSLWCIAQLVKNTLLAAAKAAGLVDALSGDKALTVFAPTDDAFAKLPKDTVATLLKPENKDKLKAILLFHVVEGRVYSEDALAAKSAATLQGSKVEITVKDGAAYVNGAKILATDVDASNGVIHIIDSVILPPAK